MRALPGKPVYVKMFSLQVGLSTGIMTNFTDWKYSDVDLLVCLTINDQILYQGPIAATGSKFTFSIPDTEIETAQEFKIALNQIPGSVSNTSPMLKIDYVWIENLCMRKTLEDSGICVFYQRPSEINIPSEYMGQPGVQTLKFSTPIYPWLLNNQKCANYYYKQ